MEERSEFDYTQLTKSELDELYHKIIDVALQNHEYKLYVIRRWKINYEEFHRRAAASIAIRIQKEEKKLKIRRIILEYFDNRWKTMTTEEAEREWQHLRAEVNYRSPN